MSISPELPFISGIVAAIAADEGWTVTVDPEFSSSGRVCTPAGTCAFYRNAAFDINPFGASELVKDKDRTAFFLAEAGYPTPQSRKFYRSGVATVGRNDVFDDMIAFARDCGYPVFVKPNSGYEGRHVSQVATDAELKEAASNAFTEDVAVLLQPVYTGRDVRIVVVDGVVMAAYEKKPLSVVGDGVSSIRALLFSHLASVTAIAQRIKIESTDYRIRRRLARMGYSLESVLEAGEEVCLLDNANLSTGGTAVDVTDTIDASFATMATEVTRALGLRFAGVDIIVNQPVTEPLADTYVILELNAKVGLRYFAARGERERKRVREVYTTVLRTMLSL